MNALPNLCVLAVADTQYNPVLVQHADQFIYNAYEKEWEDKSVGERRWWCVKRTSEGRSLASISPEEGEKIVKEVFRRSL